MRTRVTGGVETIYQVQQGGRVRVQTNDRNEAMRYHQFWSKSERNRVAYAGRQGAGLGRMVRCWLGDAVAMRDRKWRDSAMRGSLEGHEMADYGGARC